MSTFTELTAEPYIPSSETNGRMSSPSTITPTFASDLDSRHRAEVWEYNKELKELGFPTKLRRELVEEYTDLLREEHSRPTQPLVQ